MGHTLQWLLQSRGMDLSVPFFSVSREGYDQESWHSHPHTLTTQGFLELYAFLRVTVCQYLHYQDGETALA